MNNDQYCTAIHICDFLDAIQIAIMLRCESFNQLRIRDATSVDVEYLVEDLLNEQLRDNLSVEQIDLVKKTFSTILSGVNTLYTKDIVDIDGLLADETLFQYEFDF